MYLSPNDVAAELSVNRQTVYVLIKPQHAGTAQCPDRCACPPPKLQSMRVGRSVKIHRDALDAFIARHTTLAEGE